jgi:hypothetical protein
MKKIIVLLFAVISFSSCQQLVKKIEKGNRFKGHATYKTTAKEMNLKMAKLTGLSAETISNQFSSSSFKEKKTYKLGITVKQAPEILFIDSISKTVYTNIYTVLSEEVLNLKEFDAVVITFRDDKKEDGITKRQEYIIEKKINK